MGLPLTVNPVVPPDSATEVTVPLPDTAVHETVVPLVVKTFPLLPVWLGAKASNAALAVVCPVPPLAIARVPARVIVPDVVIGLPDTVSPVVPPDNATDVTVPPELAACQVGTPPERVSTYPFVPAVNFDNVLVADAYIRSPVAYVLNPVPPDVAPRVPASVTAPVVDVLGVSPDKEV